MPVTATFLRTEVLKALDDNERNPKIGLDSHLVDLLRATQEQWAETNDELHLAVEKKGVRLHNAQRLFVAGLLLCGAIVIKDLIASISAA
jgi:hypothetical protein